MKESFVVVAESRSLQGKGASRRLRREGKVPAIIYGGELPAQTIAVNLNELRKHLKVEAFYSRILTVDVSGETQQAVLKDLQRHPVRSDDILHLDLQRVRANRKLRMHVPLHFVGSDIAPGVKVGSGVVEHHMIQVEVECLPGNLPEYLEVDLSQMEVDDSIHLSDLKLPPDVELVELMHDNDAAVAAIHLPRAAVEAADEQEAAPQAAPEAPASDANKGDKA